MLGPPAVAGAAAVGSCVCALSDDATTRHPPCDLGDTEATVNTLVAGLTTGFAADAVPLISTRLPRFFERSCAFPGELHHLLGVVVLND